VAGTPCPAEHYFPEHRGALALQEEQVVPGFAVDTLKPNRGHVELLGSLKVTDD
jgi:hypothetical protein